MFCKAQMLPVSLCAKAGKLERQVQVGEMSYIDGTAVTLTQLVDSYGIPPR
jgi:hypothetical protein